MPSVVQARRAVALSAIAGLGVYRPPASAPSAKRLTGSNVTGGSYRVRAEHGRTTASLAASAAVLTQAGGEGGVLATMTGGSARSDANGDLADRTLLRGLTDGVGECLRKANLTLPDIDLVIGEQSAPEIMQAWCKTSGVSSSRLVLNPARYGSLLAAAPLMALHGTLAH